LVSQVEEEIKNKFLGSDAIYYYFVYYDGNDNSIERVVWHGADLVSFLKKVMHRNNRRKFSPVIFATSSPNKCGIVEWTCLEEIDAANSLWIGDIDSNNNMIATLPKIHWIWEHIRNNKTKRREKNV